MSDLPSQSTEGFPGCPPGQSCMNNPKDFPCESGFMCDPMSMAADRTGCSPKVAYVMVCDDISDMGRYNIGYYVNHITRFFKDEGYHIIEVDPASQDDVAMAVMHSSTKAVAVFSHSLGKKSTMPNTPALACLSAPMLEFMMESFAKTEMRKLGLTNEMYSTMQQRIDAPKLDYVYNYACFSLDTKDLAHYLVRPGGTYWGSYGIQVGFTPLERYDVK